MLHILSFANYLTWHWNLTTFTYYFTVWRFTIPHQKIKTWGRTLESMCSVLFCNCIIFVLYLYCLFLKLYLLSFLWEITFLECFLRMLIFKWGVTILWIGDTFFKLINLMWHIHYLGNELWKQNLRTCLVKTCVIDFWFSSN